MRRDHPLKVLLTALGILSLVIGVIGIFVPLLPTSPFVLLAAWCFARSSNRFHYWLLHHRLFGPMIRNWNERRAIPRSTKIVAILMTMSSLVIVTVFVPLMWLKVAILACLATVILFIGTRPD